MKFPHLHRSSFSHGLCEHPGEYTSQWNAQQVNGAYTTIGKYILNIIIMDLF